MAQTQCGAAVEGGAGVVKRLVWNERSTAGANARRVLPQIMAEYFAEVRKALKAKPSPANLHKVRLASKKVRYTLELFKPCYGEEFEEHMKALKDVQTTLGDVNDAVTAEQLIRDAMPQSPRRKALRSNLKKRAEEKAEEFRVHWMEQFDADGNEKRWLSFLQGRG